MLVMEEDVVVVEVVHDVAYQMLYMCSVTLQEIQVRETASSWRESTLSLSCISG